MSGCLHYTFPFVGHWEAGQCVQRITGFESISFCAWKLPWLFNCFVTICHHISWADTCIGTCINEVSRGNIRCIQTGSFQDNLKKGLFIKISSDCFITCYFIKIANRASLVVQWLRICLPMQGTWVRALVWEDPTCRGATGPVSHSYWACASGAYAPPQEKPQ